MNGITKEDLTELASQFFGLCESLKKGIVLGHEAARATLGQVVRLESELRELKDRVRVLEERTRLLR